MKKLYLLLTLLLGANFLFAQLPDWSTAPDFSLPDLNDDYHELYDYLDEGYSAVLDFSATWCGPCWNYHQTGILEDIYDEYGPAGEDKVMVFMIEADPGTTPPCIYGPSGCSGGSIGDWTAGVTYPILNPEASEAATVNTDFQINYYPTLYGVSPIGEIIEIGQASFSVWESWVAESFQMHNTSWTTNEEDCTESFIDLHPVGGHDGIDYQWSNGATTEDLYDIAPGEYTVTMTDGHDYEVVKGPIEIKYNNGANIVLDEIEHIECFGEETGIIDIHMEGGSDDFEFYWSNGSNDEDLEDAPGGTYELLVIDLDSGCEFEMEFEIEEPETLEYELEIENAPCGSAELGAVEFFVDGGTWPVTFFFEDFDTRDDYVELPAGDYTVTIMDFNGCELETESFTIESVDAPLAYAGFSGLLNCVNDSISISIDSSSSGPMISYEWYSPDSILIGQDSQLYVMTEGMYTLNVINLSSGCTSVDSVFVMSDYSSPELEADVIQSWHCSDHIAILGGFVNVADSLVTYSWSTLGGEISSDPHAAEIEVSAFGLYQLEVTHIASGCIETGELMIQEPELPEITYEGELEFCEESTTEICFDFDSNFRVDYEFNGEPISTIGNQTCIIFSEAGDLIVTVVDQLTDCSSSESLVLEQFEVPELQVLGESSFCEGSQTQLCIQTDSENISWYREGDLISSQECITVNDASSYTATVQSEQGSCIASVETQTEIIQAPDAIIIGDAGFCAGDIAELCQTDTNLSSDWLLNGVSLAVDASCVNVNTSGELQLIVTNPMNDCQASSIINITEYATPSIESLMADGELGCDNTAVVISMESQQSTYDIEWYDPDGELIAQNQTQIEVNTPGVYTVKLISENECSTEESIELTSSDDDLPIADFDFEPQGLLVQFENKSSDNVDLYLWEFGDGTRSSEENPIHEYMSPGIYDVVLTSTNSCGESRSTQEVHAYSQMQISIITSNVSCNGGEDGRIKVNVFGGVPDYTFNWELNGNSISGDPEINMLAAGTYRLQLTDLVGQEIIEEITINEPEALEIESSITPSRSGESEGAIIINVSGGNGDYSYNWNNGSNSQNLENITQGLYTVTVTDSKQCTIIKEFEVLGTTSLDEITGLNFFRYGPNPFESQLALKLEFNSKTRFTLELYDINGRLLNKVRNEATEWGDVWMLDRYETGLYFLVLTADQKQASFKLVKH